MKDGAASVEPFTKINWNKKRLDGGGRESKKRMKEKSNPDLQTGEETLNLQVGNDTQSRREPKKYSSKRKNVFGEKY